MIIPVRCFTCNKVLGDKWNHYKRRVAEMKDSEQIDDADLDNDVTNGKEAKEPRGRLLDEMGITRVCCRRHLLTHVDLIDIV